MSCLEFEKLKKCYIIEFVFFLLEVVFKVKFSGSSWCFILSDKLLFLNKVLIILL